MYRYSIFIRFYTWRNNIGIPPPIPPQVEGFSPSSARGRSNLRAPKSWTDSESLPSSFNRRTRFVTQNDSMGVFLNELCHYGELVWILPSLINRFLECGILHNGFARVRCGECSHEHLTAFSCRRQDFSPLFTKSEWLSLANGCAGRIWEKCSIVISSSALPRSRHYFLYWMRWDRLRKLSDFLAYLH
jgi:hypothetical protein